MSTRICFNRNQLRYFVFESLPQDVLLHNDRSKSIIYLSDDDLSEEDSTVEQETNGVDNQADDFEPHLMEEDTRDANNRSQQILGSHNEEEFQGDLDYPAYLQTLIPDGHLHNLALMISVIQSIFWMTHI